MPTPGPPHYSGRTATVMPKSWTGLLRAEPRSYCEATGCGATMWTVSPNLDRSTVVLLL